MRLNWRKIAVLVLLSEMLILYWSTLQHKETVRMLEEQSRLQNEQPVSVAPRTAPPPQPNRT